MSRKGRAKSRATRSRARAAGYKSDFEWHNGKQLGDRAEYEPWSIEYVIVHKYTPDFELDNGIIVETKGIWESADRTKHLRIREQHPELDIRFVFMRDNPLRRGSKITYTQWCEKNGFQYAVGEVPQEWLDE